MYGSRVFAAALAVAGLAAVVLVQPTIDAYRLRDKRLRLAAYERFLATHPFAESGRRDDDASHREDPGERYRQEYLMMVDPVLGTVPRERFVAANRAAARLRFRLGKASSTLPTWQERGPDDVGGRTRAIMFDPNDGAHEKVWAGGVAGGLWYTNDITDSGEPWHNVDDFWSNLAVSAIAYDPTSTLTFYVGTGEGFFNFDALSGAGIFKSTDGGASWSQLPSTTGSTWSAVQAIVVTSSGTVLAATREGGGVQRSTDGGGSWTSVLHLGSGAGTSRAADLEIAADGDIYAAMGIFSTDGVWKSVDDGVSWTKLNTGANGFPTSGFDRLEIAVAPSDSNRVYVLSQDDGTPGVGAIYRSDDQGATWDSVNTPIDCYPSIGADFTRGQAWYNLILAVKPDDEDVLLAGGIDLFRSDNAGSTVSWNQLSVWNGSGSCSGIPVVHADQHAIVFRPDNPDEAVFGNDGGIFYTADVRDNPPDFDNRNNGYNVTQFYAVAQSPTSASNLMIGGTQDNGTPKLNGAGVSGQVADVTGGDGAFTHINQTTNVLGMASNQYLSFHRSLNGGITFSFLGSISGGGSFINPSDLDEDPDHLFFNYSSTLVGRWDHLTGGGSPSAVGIGPSGGFGSVIKHVRNSEYSPAGTSTVYLGSNAGRIFRVEDAHDPPAGPPVTPSWSELNTTPLPIGAITCIELGGSEDTLAVTFSNYGVSSVWYTTDGGSNWDDLDAGTNLPDMSIWWALIDPFDNKKLYIGTEAGLFYTDDLTASPVVWSVDPGIPITRVVMMKYRTSDHQMILGTHGRGIWTATIEPPTPPPAEPAPRLVATILLDGPYAGSGTMVVGGMFVAARPLDQPYSAPIFNGKPNEYDGVDSVLSFPSGTVDWMLVEFRTDVSPDSLVSGSKRPALLLDDGALVGLDGDTLRFEGVEPGNYHIVFRHRNHLAVMTADPYDFSAGPVVVDLSTSLAAAYADGGSAMRNLGGGYFGMYAADGSQDGQITAPDFNAFSAATSAGLTGYPIADYNLDGVVTAPDFNKFSANTSAGAKTQVPE